MALSRRAFLSRAALLAGVGVAGTTVLSGCVDDDDAAAATRTLPAPARSGIDHIVVVTMENRSFDHFLGWVPGADGRQAGLIFADRHGAKHHTYHQTRFSSCGLHDPDHSYDGGRIELDGGKCDGWLRAGRNGSFAISYFEQDDLAFLGNAARDWTTCDRYFAATMAATYPNRFYQHAAQTDRLYNALDISRLPTIWDRLSDAGVSGRYYFSDVPFLALWGNKYRRISAPFTQFRHDAAAGALPAVSYVDPRFADEQSGASNDDHPHADIRAGEAFLNEVYEAVVSSPNWARAMLVLTFDEWGGFFDHVAPTEAPDNSARSALRGFRVPAVIISPRARRRQVDHTVYDHTSILSAIEWRWNLEPLTRRDAAAANIVTALDFTAAPQLNVPRYDVPSFVPEGCEADADPHGEDGEWSGLTRLAAQLGWRLPG